jgi:hypothetical protein
MAKYVNETSRINVKFIDSDTEDVIFDIKDRNWMNFSELFPAHTVSELMTRDSKKQPDEIMVIAVAYYKKV